MAEKKVQEQLFQLIRDSLPASVALIDAVAEALHLSPDSTYRRLRGDTPLVLEEVKVLCQAFSLSLDSLLQTTSDSIVFKPVLVNNTISSFDSFLSGLIQSLQHVASFQQKELIYLSKDIPVFHYFYSKPLFAFRYFFWMKTILQHPDFVNETFSMTHVPPAAEAKAQQVTRLYKNIPSTEIWNSEGINSMLAQIDYYREAGYFTAAQDIALLYDGLRETIEHISNQAECGCKFLPGENSSVQQSNYNLYFNQVVIGDNTILVQTDGRKTVYINYDVLNYISTTNEKFCNDTYEKMQNLIRHATILSNVSEKQRRMFFNGLLKKIPHYKTVF
jgi:hypothetical protein